MTATGSCSTHSTRSEEHTSELQSPCNLVCRLLLEKKTNTLIPSAVLLGGGLSVPHLTCQCNALTAELPGLYSRAPTPTHRPCVIRFFFFNDTATTEIYTLSLHDALPISWRCGGAQRLHWLQFSYRSWSFV